MAVKSSSRNKPQLGDAQLQAVASLFAVLSEPTRLRILQVLRHGPATVGQIMDATGIKQANASKQLGILHQAGVLCRQKEGNSVQYSIRLPLISELCDLVCDGLRRDAETRARALRGG